MAPCTFQCNLNLTGLGKLVLSDAICTQDEDFAVRVQANAFSLIASFFCVFTSQEAHLLEFPER